MYYTQAASSWFYQVVAHQFSHCSIALLPLVCSLPVTLWLPCPPSPYVFFVVLTFFTVTNFCFPFRRLSPSEICSSLVSFYPAFLHDFVFWSALPIVRPLLLALPSASLHTRFSSSFFFCSVLSLLDVRFCTRQNFHATTLAEILFLAFCLLFPLGYVCASLISALSCSSTSCVQSVSYFCCYFCPIVCSSWSSSSSHACGSSGLCVFFFALLSPVCSNYCKKFLAPIVFPFASSSLIITSSVLTLYSIFICLWAFPALDLPLPALSYSASIHSLLKLLLCDCHVIHLAFRVRKNVQLSAMLLECSLFLPSCAHLSSYQNVISCVCCLALLSNERP